jgi:hypothetical protein
VKKIEGELEMFAKHPPYVRLSVLSHHAGFSERSFLQRVKSSFLS